METYLDEGYERTCLKAANFILVEKTAGRGRQDRKNLRQKTVKRIFVRPLRRDWRRRLGVPRVELAATLPIGAGLNSEEWDANEFGEARLEDQRLTARLINSASLLAEYPERAINAVIRHVISDDIFHVRPGANWGGATRSNNRFSTATVR